MDQTHYENVSRFPIQRDLVQRKLFRPGIEIQELNARLASAFVARSKSQLDSPILELVRQDITVSCLFHFEEFDSGRLRLALYSPNALIVDVLR
jgi:hypothetical protein